MKQGRTLQELRRELQRQRKNRQDFLSDTRGGCNPIPIEYSISDGKLKVPQAELEKNAKIFK